MFFFKSPNISLKKCSNIGLKKCYVVKNNLSKECKGRKRCIRTCWEMIFSYLNLQVLNHNSFYKEGKTIPLNYKADKPNIYFKLLKIVCFISLFIKKYVSFSY